MPKVVKARKQDPLYKSIEESKGHLRSHPRHKRANENVDTDDVDIDADADEEYVSPQATRKILDLARSQQDEMAAEESAEQERNEIRMPSRTEELVDEDEEQWVTEGESDSEADQEEYDEVVHYEVDPEEEAVFERYAGGLNEDGEPINLADRIMAKIAEHKAKKAGVWQPPGAESGGVRLPPKVIDVYTQVGELLSRYRSGRLPRAFKIVPSLRNWRDVLYVTGPESWSNQAVYEATKLFVSNLPSNQAHRFIEEVLLDRFHEQVRGPEHAVNYHVYRALKKALYKPAAFFKGFLFPLLEEGGGCTLREAVVAGSILARVSIPALHSAAALLHIAEIEDYSGPHSLFIRVLLDKKYALPFKVVDAMVFHFVRFREHDRALPVIWHQSFLTFAQRYKNDITDDQRDALLAVCRLQQHPQISQEIRRELLAGSPRVPEQGMQA